jgi:hypothetical protein
MPLSPDAANRRTLLDPRHEVPAGRAAQSAMPPAIRDDALRHAPGRPVVMVRPAPVKVRSSPGYAVAYTVTHVLVESDNDGAPDAKWVASWMVRRL